MAKPETGGAAFPYHIPEKWYDCDQGMTLRDYFAAAALQGLLANPNCNQFHLGNPAGVIVNVDTAYRCADEMINQREKTNG